MNVLKSNKGFSLVELMVVVAIIGILAAVAIPQFSKFQARSRQSEAKAHLSGIYTAEKSFIAEFNQAYGGLRTIGYSPDAGGAASAPLRYNAGFTAVGPINPGTNITPPAGDNPGLSGGTVCAISTGAVACTFHPQFTVGALVGAVNPAGTIAFTAAANGNPNARTLGGVDRWTITQDKVLTWAANGID